MEKQHISSRFDCDLDNLQNLLIKMGHFTEQQLQIVRNFIKNDQNSVENLNRIIELDENINQLQINIDQEIIRIMATRSPVAKDLRFIASCYRMATDFERIGDEISKIGRFLKETNASPDNLLWRDIKTTAKLAQLMLKRAVDALVRNDSDDAYLLLEDDEDLNQNYKNVIRQMASYMMEDPKHISTAIDILFAAKALERVGDHAINIAEAVIFYRKGVDVRKKSKK